MISIVPFFDHETFTVSYVVVDEKTRHCGVIDPVLDFDPNAGRISYTSADRIIAHVRERSLTVDLILETHAHADHLSSASYIKDICGGKIAIGRHIVQVQATFTKLFNLGEKFQPTGVQFDRLLDDGESFTIGSIEGRATYTPGHTPACMTYLLEDAAFVGDTLFMPDYGTARADFPGGDARTLYRSIRKIFALPATTRLFMCHDYGTPTRETYLWETTVTEQRRINIHMRDGVTEDAFVIMREARDKTLPLPRLFLPSLQVNICAGRLPMPEGNGLSYLKLPINAF